MLKGPKQAKNHPKANILFSLYMSIIICEHLLELWRSFTFLVCCGNLASVPKATVITYFRISYFGHASPK